MGAFKDKMPFKVNAPLWSLVHLLYTSLDDTTNSAIKQADQVSLEEDCITERQSSIIYMRFWSPIPHRKRNLWGQEEWNEPEEWKRNIQVTKTS